MQWISVKDRLPERQQRVIIGNAVSKTVCEAIYSCNTFRLGLLDQTLYVTHWMPLPEPPKE